MFGGAKQTFGQTPTTSAFGFNNTATTIPFGQTTFGKPQQSTGFGQTAAFGQQNTSLFGGGQAGGLFGATNPTSAFGSPVATTQSGFGGSFGQSQQNTSLFGSPQANANTSLFGAPAGTFGAAKPNNFGFAGTQPTTSLFAQASTNSNTTTTGFFGQNTTTGGLFGSTTPVFAPGVNGSAVAKYQPSLGSDTLVKNGQQSSVSTKQHCITAMKEYESKSLEELRMEDYTANRKGPPVGQAGALFGATAPNTGVMFGTQQPAQQTPNGLFAQTAENKILFNQPGNLNFGQTAPAFGTTNQTASGIFGKPFNATTTATPSFGFNNTQTNTNPFGAKPSFGSATPGLFGQPASSTSTSSAFGQAATGFASFGATTNQSNSLFGVGSDKPAFGVSSAPTNTGFQSFGASNSATTNTGLFGAKPTTNFSFGQPTAQPNTVFNGFAQPATGNSIFNTTFNKPAAPTFGFGTHVPAQTSISTGLTMGNNTLFGNPVNKPAGLFGQPAGQTGGLFCNTSVFNGGNAMGNFGVNMIGSNAGLGSTTNQVNPYPLHQQIMALTTSPYGDSALFKDLKARGINEESLKPTNPAAQKAFLETTSKQFKVSPKIGNTINIRLIGSHSSKKSLFEGLEEFDSTVEESFNLNPNIKRLMLNKNSISITNCQIESPTNNKYPIVSGQSTQTSSIISSNYNVIQQKNHFETSELFEKQTPTTPLSSIMTTELDTTRRVSWLQSNTVDKIRSNICSNDRMFNNTITELLTEGNNVGTLLSQSTTTTPDTEYTILNQRSDANIRQHQFPKNTLTTSSASGKSARFNAQTSFDSIISNRTLDESQLDVQLTNIDAHPTGIILQRPGYYTIPSMDDLISYLSVDGSCIVPNFTIGREGYGNVFFNEPIDVMDLNLDQIVHFRHKEITIYADDDNKPPIGCGLNRKAQITLDQVWPYDKQHHEPIKNSERLALMDYEGKLRRVCEKHSTRFIDYRPESGSWVFRVEHFSKYGLSDSDEEDDEPPADPKKAKLNLIQKNINQRKKNINNDMLKKSSIINIEPLETDDESNMNFIRLQSLNYSNYHNTTTKSPSSELAKDVGSDSHKLQLMKASFFTDDEYSGKSTPYSSGRSTPDQIVPIKSILKPMDIFNNQLNDITHINIEVDLQASSSVFSKKDYNSEINNTNNINNILTRQYQNNQLLIDATAHSLVVKPKIAMNEVSSTIIPLCDSIIAKMSCLSDIGFMHGRHFKVGWGLKNSIFVLNTINNCHMFKKSNYNLENLAIFLSGRPNDDSSLTILQNLKISSMKNIDSFEKKIVPHLKIQLEHSERNELITDGCIQLISKGGTKALNKHFELATKLCGFGELEQYSLSVWSLLKSLWGERDDLYNQEKNNHYTIMCRRELFSDWLESVTIIDELLMEKNKDLTSIKTQTNYLEHLFDLLKCHKLVEACELAFMNNDINLSMLLSQISGGPAVRQLLHHQLSSWQAIEADKFINIGRLKALMLIAGVPIFLSHYGTIRIFDNMDWIKCLGLCLWYMCSPTSSITDALLMYEKSFENNEFYASPQYSATLKIKSSKQIQDLRFHLLKLYSKRSHPMEFLLNPGTHTSDIMDYRLSWLLLQNLESLGYHHCSELSECQLHVSFSNQLETNGLWHWSIFVLLHIKNQERREICIQQILYRYIELSDDNEYMEKEKFILELGISENWLYWAKSVKACAEKNYHAQANYLLKARQWRLAHDVVMTHIAPDAIINDNISYIKSLLLSFEDPKQISNWTIQGQMLLDYIIISEKFENLKSVAEGHLELLWEELKPQLAELCSRINQFPCPTSKDRLCQSEIAQKLSCLVRGVLLTCPSVNPCLLIKVALEKLPLPQEYAQQELRVLLDSFSSDSNLQMES